VILGLELADFWATVNAWTDNGEHGIGVNSTRTKPDTKLISINSSELLTKANYQDFHRFQPVDVAMPADAEATLPALIEAVKAAIPADRQSDIEKRGDAATTAYAERRAPPTPRAAPRGGAKVSNPSRAVLVGRTSRAGAAA